MPQSEITSKHGIIPLPEVKVSFIEGGGQSKIKDKGEIFTMYIRVNMSCIPASYGNQYEYPKSQLKSQSNSLLFVIQFGFNNAQIYSIFLIMPPG